MSLFARRPNPLVPSQEAHHTLLAQGQREQLVIVGFGIVAHRFVERMAATGALKRFAVTVIGEEYYPAYDRVRLTSWFEHRDWERLILGKPDWAQSLGVRTITGTRVLSIDRKNSQIGTAAGEWIGYDRLVLATGSVPWIPPIDGADHPHVFAYRSIDDLRTISECAIQANTAIVIGGGPLGIESAAALRQMELQVSVLETSPYLMSQHLDEVGAELLQARVNELGIRIFGEALVHRIEPEGTQLSVSVHDWDEPVAADMVVITTGVRPMDELAQTSGLEVGSGFGGIVIDNALRTSDPKIHAISDCARHNDNLCGLVAPGYRMAESLAEILAGRSGSFQGYVSAIRLRLQDANVWTLGEHDLLGERVRWNQGDSYRQITLLQNRVVAASSIGPWEELSFVQDLIVNRRRIRKWRLNRFAKTGNLSLRYKQAPVAERPVSVLVCNCLQITRGTLSASITKGCSTIEALAEGTGASTVCGSCRPLLSELLGESSASSGRLKRPGLVVATAAAILMALIIVSGVQTPLADSVRTNGIWDVMYRNGWWRQATGYGLLAGVAVAFGFSLRKRWARIGWGNFGGWRLAHSMIGILALAALVLHTGLRLGSGFNRVFLSVFLIVSVLGALAALYIDRKHARLTLVFSP